nr:hypothetical protein [Tanacetum cinerariifolium]
MVRVVDQWLEAESDLASAQARPHGRLRVDMGSTMATMLVLPALPDFQKRYPELQLDIGPALRHLRNAGLPRPPRHASTPKRPGKGPPDGPLFFRRHPSQAAGGIRQSGHGRGTDTDVHGRAAPHVRGDDSAFGRLVAGAEPDLHRLFAQPTFECARKAAVGRGCAAVPDCALGPDASNRLLQAPPNRAGRARAVLLEQRGRGSRRRTVCRARRWAGRALAAIAGNAVVAARCDRELLATGIAGEVHEAHMQVAACVQGDGCVVRLKLRGCIVGHDVLMLMLRANAQFVAEVLPRLYQVFIVFKQGERLAAVGEAAAKVAFARAPVQPVRRLLLKAQAAGEGFDLLPLAAGHAQRSLVAEMPLSQASSLPHGPYSLWERAAILTALDGAGHAGDVEQGDGACQRAGLEHQDDFIAVGWQADARRAGQNDVQQCFAFGHAQCTGCFYFPGRYGLDGAAQDLCDVGGGVQGHGQGCAKERITQIRPHRAFGDDLKLRQPLMTRSSQSRPMRAFPAMPGRSSTARSCKGTSAQRPYRRIMKRLPNPGSAMRHICGITSLKKMRERAEAQAQCDDTRSKRAQRQVRDVEQLAEGAHGTDRAEVDQQDPQQFGDATHQRGVRTSEPLQGPVRRGLRQRPEQTEDEPKAQGRERKLEGHQHAGGEGRAESIEIEVHNVVGLGDGRRCLNVQATARVRQGFVELVAQRVAFAYRDADLVVALQWLAFELVVLAFFAFQPLVACVFVTQQCIEAARGQVEEGVFLGVVELQGDVVAPVVFQPGAGQGCTLGADGFAVERLFDSGGVTGE